VAFEVRLNLDILRQSGCDVNELRIIGGGARSLKLVRLKADVIGMPVVVPEVTEAGCIGVAMLARAYHSNLKVGDIAKKWIRTVTRIEPKNTDHYNSKFQQYKKLYHVLKTFY
jgi:xylulokinase